MEKAFEKLKTLVMRQTHVLPDIHMREDGTIYSATPMSEHIYEITNLKNDIANFGEEMGVINALVKCIVTSKSIANVIQDNVESVYGDKSKVFGITECAFIVSPPQKPYINLDDKINIGPFVIVEKGYGIPLNCESAENTFGLELSDEDYHEFLVASALTDYSFVPTDKKTDIDPDYIFKSEKGTPASSFLSVILDINNKFKELGSDLYINVQHDEMFLFKDKPIKYHFYYDFKENKIIPVVPKVRKHI